MLDWFRLRTSESNLNYFLSSSSEQIERDDLAVQLSPFLLRFLLLLLLLPARKIKSKGRFFFQFTVILLDYWRRIFFDFKAFRNS